MQMTYLLWIDLYISRPIRWLEVQMEASSGRRSVKHLLPIIAAESNRLSFIGVNKLERGILLFYFCTFDNEQIWARVYLFSG